MSPDQLAIEQRARRVKLSVETLKEIELAVTLDSNMSGIHDRETQRQRIDSVVAIYRAHVVAESLP